MNVRNGGRSRTCDFASMPKRRLIICDQVVTPGTRCILNDADPVRHAAEASAAV